MFDAEKFVADHQGTDVYEIIELAYKQGKADGHSEQLGTNLAEVGTDSATKRTVKGFPIDADLLMLKVEEKYGFRARDRLYELIRNMPKYELPPAQPEPLTDKEQRIFLAAMERERKVCKEVDDQYVHEPYEVLLTKVCDEIKRKVKKVLWI